MDFFSRHSQSFTEPGTLITFYEDASTDNRGRRLTDILRWGVNKLESSHDYIQTLFPLPERSGINDRAPIIDRQVFEAFRARPELRDRLRDAFKKMLWFYGFELQTDEEGKMMVKKGHNYQVHSQNWLTRFDHNHLRITRIIRSLRVLGLEDEALAFYNTISSATIVSSRSRMYWGRATHRPLNIRPDIDDDEIEDERIGPKFLREYEQARREAEKEQAAENGATIEHTDDQGKQQIIVKNGSGIDADHSEQTDGLKGGQMITQNGSAKEEARQGEATQDQPDKKIESLGEAEQLELITPKPTADDKGMKDE